MTLVLFLCALVFPVPALIGSVVYFNVTRSVIPCALICAVAVSAVVAGFQTGSEPDLYRYVQQAALRNGIPFSDIYKLAYGNLPITAIWLWVCGQTGFYFSYQSSVALVVFFSAFYIVFDVSQHEEFSSFQVALTVLLLFTLLPVFNAIEYARSSAAFSLGVLGLYINVVKRQTRNVISWALMLIPGFIHTAGWFVIVLRGLVFVFGRSRIAAFSIATFLIPLALVLSPLLSSLTVNLNADPVSDLIRYSEWTEGYAANIAASRFHQVLRIVSVSFTALLALDCLLSGRSEMNDERFFGSLRMLVILFAGVQISFAVSIIPPSYLRFAYAAAPLIAAYIGLRIGATSKWAILGKKYTSPFAGMSYIIQLGLLIMSCALFALYVHNANYYLYQEPFFESILFGYVGVFA